MMMRFSYEEVVERIKETSGKTDDEISLIINSKLSQFAGLVSKEGAAYILANELGIKLVDNSSPKPKITNIVAGMQNLELLAKVLAVFEPKQFNSNGRQGQIGSVILGDETGSIRSVFWNDQANKLSFISKGDILKLQGVYVKQGMNNLELHVNDRSVMVINPPGESVEAKAYERSVTRKKLNELSDTDRFVQVLGTVVEVFDLRFFEVCPQCNKRARPQEDKYSCQSHGAVEPGYSYVMNIFLDDGTAAVRTVFFREAAQKLLQKSHDELLQFKDVPETFEQIKNDALGSFIKLNARVSKNEMFDRVELVASEVEHSSPAESAASQVVSNPVESKVENSSPSGSEASQVVSKPDDAKVQPADSSSK